MHTTHWQMVLVHRVLKLTSHLAHQAILLAAMPVYHT